MNKPTCILKCYLLCTITRCLLLAPKVFANDGSLDFYGYFSWNIEKVFSEPSVDGSGNTVKEDASREISLPYFNIMTQSQVNDRFKVFVNLSGGGAEEVEVSNLWGEYSHNQYLNVRLGKSYRRFGLYNELLDAVPTYMGIEPPELFDNDHLMISRTTLFMVHGWVPFGTGSLNYSIATDNGEGGPKDDQLPLGFDLRYESELGDSIYGISGYSSNGETNSDVGVGEGSPRTGVLPWMAEDDFTVIGFFAEHLFMEKLKVQYEYWTASHDATRDADAVVSVINNAGINARQRERFLLDNNGAVNAANVDLDGDYDVKTWYIRAGYSILTKKGEVVPYIQWDHYAHDETIQNKNWGGDNEAGLSDDGEFQKGTLGVVYRPVPEVALKLDVSSHFQEFNGRSNSYPEIRFDVSYIFGQ